MKPTLRIIGGQHRGRRLYAVAGTRTRPTANRVREAIFNILSDRIRGKTVLDLFAGTGAMAIEALSRGAASAVCIDNSPAAVDTIRRNGELCRMTDRLRVIRWPIQTGLTCVEHHRPAFDIAFMDPPYETGHVGACLQSLAGSHCLAPDGVVVVEHGPREPVEAVEGPFDRRDQRRYGKSLVSFFAYMV